MSVILRAKIRLVHRKIHNIKNNYIYQITAEILKISPSRVIMEDLNIRDIMKIDIFYCIYEIQV